MKITVSLIFTHFVNSVCYKHSIHLKLFQNLEMFQFTPFSIYRNISSKKIFNAPVNLSTKSNISKMVRHVINKTYRLEAMKAYFDKLRIGLTIFDISIYPTAILVIYIGCINNQTYNLVITEVRLLASRFWTIKDKGF